ncbi:MULTISPECIES: GNAT family N-acetyltransferase [Bifidobacterium]|uniref:Acetyltransferase n=2 Tax=Bifidobacterium TaxID=1678 RepID=A0A087CIX6_9BIFI|nr:GNAT family N-acetyltransferase [Bifidobacterium psychraerophilum]KFI83226.1 Acetyltransferase [Bifidobacterium psychraerophilum]PKA94282.1 putative glutathione S-transferase [Bifidobacterium psychraerophilum DSM 22366]
MTFLQPRIPTRARNDLHGRKVAEIPQALKHKDLDDGYKLRLAQVSEYEEVGNALAAAFKVGCWITAQYEAGLHAIEQRAKTADVWVISDGSNRIVAAVLTPKPALYDEQYYTFNILGVAPWGRGHGFGSVLVSHSIELAGSYGYEGIELHSSPQMVHAHRLYYSFGFHRRIDWETMIVDSGQRLLALTRDLSWKKKHYVRKEEVMHGSHEGSHEEVDSDQFTPKASSHVYDDIVACLSHRNPQSLPVNISLSALDPRAWGTLFTLRLGQLRTEAIDQLSTDLEHVPSGHEANPVRLITANGKKLVEDWRFASRALNIAFSENNGGNGGLYNRSLSNEIDELDAIIDNELIDGLFAVINANSDLQRDAYRRVFYARLGWFDYLLSHKKFLLGNSISESDGHLFGVLLTFDVGYRNLFPPADAAVVDYPHLWDYARSLYAIDGLVTHDEKQALGLLSHTDGNVTLPWGKPAYTETVEDIAQAWSE